MKIRSDSKFDDVIRYWQTVDNIGYYYELYVLAGTKKAVIMITNDGVSVEYITSGDNIHTNLIPKRMFPNQKELSWSDITRIVKTLEAINCEGKVFSAEEMKKFFES